MHPSGVIVTVLLGLLSWTSLSLWKNYRTARQIGLPIVLSPVTPLNPFWILSWRLFPQILLLRYLPFGLGRWARCTYIGWSFDDKHALHDELGEIFTIVTPGGNEVVVADAESAQVVFSRRKEYVKPAVMYEQLNVFGPNLNTVEGEDWQRHRRLTAPSFNEKVSTQVWSEALRQAQDMASSWARKGSKGTDETVEDTATLALHVLTSAGFGMSYPFRHATQTPTDGHKMTYRDSLSICLKNIVTFAILPKKVLRLQWLPSKLGILGQGMQEFERYMQETLTHERELVSGRAVGSGNLVSAMLKASEESQQSGGKDAGLKISLTDDEVFGNIFAYSLAGHETTANTIAIALVLLASYPKYQGWLAEEIGNVCSDSSQPETWDYDTVFPRLQSCLAVMYETLRLYGSIVFIPKATSGESAKTLPHDGKYYIIPPSTFVTINVQAVHTDLKTWGPDHLTWRPDRWIETSDSGAIGLLSPKPGTFVPWADGPRNCPGQKFAQVEFVAVLATLFSGFRVRPVLQKGQSEEEARKWLQSMADGSKISAITLQMQQPKKVALEWVRR